MQIPLLPLASCLLSGALAAAVPGDVPPGVVPIAVTRERMADRSPGVDKRAARSRTILDALSNDRFYYTSDVHIGTPAQKLTLLMDTGSSDTWVFDHSTQSGQGGQTAPGSVFDSSKSSTYKANNSNWQIQYGIGTASGTWGHDAFSIGNAHLKSLSFGVAQQVSQIQEGIIGLGRKQAEITNKNGYTYENLPWRLKSEGQVGTAAYSLFMNDINSRDGTILFGGVDHSRYSGSLVSLPISHPKHLGVTLQNIHSDGRSQGSLMNSPQTAVLDSGTSLTYVPQDVLINIQTALNANPSFAIQEKYYCDCNITNNLIFDFGSTQVAVPAYNFLWPISEFVSGFALNFDFPENSCYLGIEKSDPSQDFILLGDNVLRGMYVVYDLENEKIAVAAANGGNGAPQVEAIVGGQIPGSS